MESKPKNLILIAGEASGDLHGAHLVEAIKRIAPSTIFSGLGGPKMRSSGVKLHADLTQLAVVGFWEVVKHYSDIKKIFHLILEKIESENVDAVILIDYPGFNLRLAKVLKKRGIKVLYYISPQVWAWKKNRVYFIKNNIDKMLVLFQFEVDFYAQFNIDVHFVGHPLIDTVQVSTSRESFLASNDLSSKTFTIGILPGSRQKEIEDLLPIMLTAAEILKSEFPNIQFLILKAPTIPESLIKHYLQHSSLPHRIITENTYNGINACDACIVASGTATLETAILQKPMVVVYKTSLLTWILAKIFVRIKNIGLVNVVAGKQIVPECVQFQATGKNIAKEIKCIITNEPKIALIKSELKTVTEFLGARGASQRAAEEILKSLN